MRSGEGMNPGYRRLCGAPLKLPSAVVRLRRNERARNPVRPEEGIERLEQAQELGFNLHGHPYMALADGTVKAVTRLDIRRSRFARVTN